MLKKLKNNLKQTLVYGILIIFFLIIIIFCFIKIVNWYLDNKKNNEIEDEISKLIKIDETVEETENKYAVDFEKFKEKNPDTVAWLKINNTNVEYVVVRANDNEYYLNHNFNKEYNIAGWIFSDYKNKFDGTDKNIVIYGHNMKNNSMFGSLQDTLKEDWYTNVENHKIILVTETDTQVYQVFSIYQIESEEYYIQTHFNDEPSYDKFLNTLKNRSIENFDIELNSQDTILTLSTCANNNYRLVLHAKRIY